MSRNNARNLIGEAIDQILQTTPDLQLIKDSLAKSAWEGEQTNDLNWAHILDPVSGVSLNDLFLHSDAKTIYDQGVEPILRRDLHERRSSYSGLYGKAIENLVKV